MKKIKLESIKDYPVRIRKKNKTRGRPSKWELLVSKMTSQLLKENKEIIRKIQEDYLVYGTSAMKILWSKPMKRILIKL